MNRREWMNSGLIILVLLILAILVAQSRRNCEIPGSSWVPCIWGEPLKPKNQADCEKAAMHWDTVSKKCSKRT